MRENYADACRMSTEQLQMPQAPHPPLTSYYGEQRARPSWVRDIFNRTAGDYDRVEAAMSAGSGARYRRWALERAGLRAGMKCVDVGSGTGLVAKQAAQLVGETGSVIGVDPSVGMLIAGAFPSTIPTVAGAGERLPLADAQFDFLSMGYALRHVADIAAAFAEFHRVLKPGGRLCILEISRPRRRVTTAVLKLYMRVFVPLVTRVVAKHAATPTLMRYYWDTIEACMPPAELIKALQVAGFRQVERRVEFGIFSEYCAIKT
jgi:demethylmenaquinone methyltransferase / 2-methoxy-6-polyprenyl-1,4-benzoquinol methylase